MKSFNIKLIGLVFLVALVLGSCKKWINTDLNTNPNQPTDAPMASILTAVEANMAFNTIGGNDASRTTSIWMQYYQGVGRQSQGIANYSLADGDVDNQWITNYTATMENLYILINKAKGSPDVFGPTFLGIGDVLMANALGITTDLWGDIPYSQAFQGATNLQPGFDKQQSIYASILLLLDDAIAQLTKVAGNQAAFASGDLMYAGDPSMWLKAANALKARYILHKSKVDQNSYAGALTALTGSFASNDDDLQFTFYSNSGQENPLYQFLQQRAGDMSMHKYFIDMLVSRQDPRLPVYADTSIDPKQKYRGADWGESGDSASLPGVAVGYANSPVIFTSYTECLFIKTECEYQTGIAPATVRADLVSALASSLNKWNVYNALYITAYTAAIDTVSGTNLLKEIMNQKYIALYNQVESFNDWRRTENIIGLVPNPSPLLPRNEIPRRYPYSLSEKNYNSNTPTNVDIWQRVWWDALLGKK